MVRVPSSLTHSIGRIRNRILTAKNGNYISRLVVPEDVPGLVTAEEATIRQSQLQKFRSDHPQVVDPILYSKFVRCLYPVSDNLGHFSQENVTESPVNPSELFYAYSNLPKPGVAYIEPQDFERFMILILEWLNFVKPNALSPFSKYYLLSRLIISAYSWAQTLRKEHAGLFWKVAEDMRLADAPVTSYERRQMVYMTFYKDRQDILDIVDDAFQKLDKSLPDYETLRITLETANKSLYSRDALIQLLEAFDLDIETANVLMDVALRHKDAKTANGIVKSISEKNMKWNRRTFQIWLENLAYQGEVNLFCSTLDSLTQEYPQYVDINLVNTLLRALVRLKLTTYAEQLVNTFSLDLYCPLEENESFLKQLTIEDKKQYDEHWRGYEKMNEKPHLALYPIEDTFFPVLSSYCTSQTTFDTIINLLFHAERVWGIPITTRMYKLLFHSFTRSRHSVDNLKFITGKLIASHDLNYDRNDSWLRNQFSAIQLPDNVMGVLNNAMSTTELLHHPDKGCFVKLSDELVLGIYLAFVNVLEDNPKLQNRAAAVKHRYDTSLTDARDNYKRNILTSPTLMDLNTRDQFTFIKKGFIIELLDLVS